MSDIADRVKSIVVEHLGVEGDKVIEGASFIDDLGADSHIGKGCIRGPSVQCLGNFVRPFQWCEEHNDTAALTLTQAQSQCRQSHNVVNVTT